MNLKTAFICAAMTGMSVAAGAAAQPEDWDKQRSIAAEAACGHKDKTVAVLKDGADEETLEIMYLWTANGLNPEGFPECQIEESTREEMLGLIQDSIHDPAKRQRILDYTLEQLGRGGRVDTARYLLEQGANPNAAVRDKRDSDTLGWAAGNEVGKAKEMVELMLQHGADPALGLRYWDNVANEEAQKARSVIIEVAKALGKVLPPQP